MGFIGFPVFHLVPQHVFAVAGRTALGGAVAGQTIFAQYNRTGVDDFPLCVIDFEILWVPSIIEERKNGFLVWSGKISLVTRIVFRDAEHVSLRFCSGFQTFPGGHYGDGVVKSGLADVAILALHLLVFFEQLFLVEGARFAE